MQAVTFASIGSRFLAATMLLLLLGGAARAGEDGWTPLGAEDDFGVWHQPTGDWYVAGDAMVDPDNSRGLVGKPGTGVMINGKTGRTKSLVTKQPFDDVELHLEFMVAKGSNSGVIFHGNYEIQILDSHGIEKPTAGHCGGIYPRAETKPTYRHIDEGSPPRVNAAKPFGEWQTLDIIFQAARFDKDGTKTAHAKFVKVVHNGQVIQENQEVPYACGPNWDRKQYPRGPIIFQGDYGPVALRNVRVRPWKASAEELNVPPEGFTALFNGKDFTGWRLSPKAKEFWSIEDGVLKSHGLLKEWGADLATEKEYRDFVLLVDFRMPTISDSGINFRGLIPEMENFGQAEQFNLRSKGGMGHLESFYFMPENIKKNMGLKEKDIPHVKYIDPEVGVWHTVKLTVIGKNVTAEYDGEVIIDRFEYPEGILSTEPAIIRFQKHVFVDGDNLGEMNPCPIEYRNIFIKELEPGTVDVPAKHRRNAAAENWPQFRGPTGDGMSDAVGPPLTWSETENIAWKTPIHDRGWSSPVIWGKQIWLTTATEDGKRLFAVCVDRDSGTITHDVKVFDVAKPERIAKVNSYASPTPVIEEGRVYVHYGTYGTACLNTQTGEILWTRRDLNCDHEMGPGASPILYGDLLILTVDGCDVQYIVALDKRTGKTAWKTDRTVDLSGVPYGTRKGYGTPTVYRTGDRLEMITPASRALFAYDPQSGKELWKLKIRGFSIVPRPVYHDGLLYVVIDHEFPELWAVKPGGNGELDDDVVVWRLRKGAPRTPSFLLVDGTVLFVSDNGIATCLDAKSGEVVWRERLGGDFSASLICAGGRVYFFDHDAVATVIEPGRKYTELARNRLDGQIRASPAVSGKALFLRTQTHLYRIEELHSPRRAS